MAGAGKPFLTTLEIAGFRSHRHTRLECDGAPVVLYGANGAGKTSILEAIAMLGPGQGMRSGSADQAVRQPDAAGWRVRAEIGSPPSVIEAALSLETGGRRSALLDCMPTARAKLARLLRVTWMTPALGRVWSEGAGERRRLLDRVAAGFFTDHAPASARYQRSMRERNLLLRGGSPDSGWLEALEATMGECGEAISSNRAETLRRIREAVGKGGSLFREADFAIVRGGEGTSPSAKPRGASEDGDIDWTRDRLRLALRSGRPRDIAAGRTLHGPHRDDLAAWLVPTGIAAANASTGEQKGILAAFCLASARALAQNGSSVQLLLDDVLTHFDDERREALLREVEAVGAQVWLTGTDPSLFRALAEGARRFELTLVDGESRLEQQS